MQEDAVHEQNKQRHSVSSSLCGQSEQDCLNERHGWTPAGTFPLKRQRRARRRTQSIVPTSAVLALNWKHGRCFCPVMFSGKPNAWFCCVCSANCGSGCDCGSQRLSSRMNYDCSSCRRSNCGSGSCSGSCCGSGCDCGYA